MMDKAFWDRMVTAWCKDTSTIDSDAIREIASQHAAMDSQMRAGYSSNPLDDEDYEDKEDDL